MSNYEKYPDRLSYIKNVYEKYCYFTINVSTEINNSDYPENWKNITKQYDHKHNGIALICGERSGIYCICYDDIDVFMSDSKLFKELKNNYEKNWEEEYRSFFKCSDKVLELLGSRELDEIDLLGNDKCVITYPTEYQDSEGKVYKYTKLSDNPLRNMSDELIDYLRSTYFPQKTEIGKLKKKKKLTGKSLICKKLVECLDVKRSENKDDWFKIGRILSVESKDLYDTFLEFSKICFDESECHKVFFENKDEISINILFDMAREDNERKYIRIRDENYRLIYPSEFDRSFFEFLNCKYNNPVLDILNNYEGKEKLENIKQEIIDYINYYLTRIDGSFNDLYVLTCYETETIKNFYFKNIKNLFKGCEFNYRIKRSTCLSQRKLIIRDIFENDTRINHKSQITFNPDKLSVKLSEFNMFNKIPIDRTIASLYSDHNITPYLDHIKHIWCDNSKISYEYVLDWFSHCLQNPNEKTDVAIVLQSRINIRNNVIIQKFEDIFGNYFLSDNGQITDLTDNILFYFIDGLKNISKAKKDKLENIITEKKLTTKNKYLTKFKIESKVNVIISSNNDFITSRDISSGIYFPLELNNGISEISEVSSEAIACYHYNRDIKGFDPKKVPRTESMQTRQLLDLNSVETFALLICTGQVDCVEEKGGWVKKSILYDTYVKQDPGRVDNLTQFYIKLNKIFKYLKDPKNTKKTKKEGRYVNFKTQSENKLFFKESFDGEWNFELNEEIAEK